MIIDNFALTMFQTCPLKYFYRMKQGWTPRRKSAALGFGGAMHEGLASWHKGDGLAVALKRISDKFPDNLPGDDWRTKAKALEVMISYAKKYPTESFDVVGAPDHPLIEQSFTLDTELFLPCRHCLSQWEEQCVEPAIRDNKCGNCGLDREPLQYGGIFDGLVESAGRVYVFEHKTTSQLGSYYFSQFRPNNQISGYVWAAAKLSGRKVGGAIVNAIGIYKASATRLERQITSRADQEIKDWLLNVYATCVRIVFAEITGQWPMHTQSCTMYGLCEFHSVDTLPHIAERQAMLEQDYQKEVWHHEDRDEAASAT